MESRKLGVLGSRRRALVVQSSQRSDVRYSIFKVKRSFKFNFKLSCPGIAGNAVRKIQCGCLNSVDCGRHILLSLHSTHWTFCLCVRVHVCMLASVHGRLCVRMLACMRACVFAYMRLCACMCVCVR